MPPLLQDKAFSLSYFHTMKTRRIIYLIPGIFFFLLNILLTISNLARLRAEASADSYGTGYLIGSQIWLYISLLCFYGSYRVSRKMKEKRDRDRETDIDNIGKD